MSNPQDENSVEMIDVISASEEGANLSLSGALKGIVEFKLAIGLIEAAVGKIDQKTAMGVALLSSEVTTGTKTIQDEVNLGIKKVRNALDNPMSLADLASRVKSLMDRLGY